MQAGTPLATIRHFLSKDEVLRILLKQALNLFVAPERAKYYFVPQIDTKIKVSGCPVPSPSTKAWNSSSFPG